MQASAVHAIFSKLPHVGIYLFSKFWQLLLKILCECMNALELLHGLQQTPVLPLGACAVGHKVQSKRNIGPLGMAAPSAQASTFQLQELL